MSKTEQRSTFIDNLLNKMTIEEKVGQCFTFSWRGSIITPSVKALIEKLHVGGLRIEPYTAESARSTYYGKSLADDNYDKPEGYFETPKTYFTAKTPSPYTPPEEYAARINELQRLATSCPSGIPLNICTDNEGACTNDYQHGGMPGYPALMGLAATGDITLTEAVGLAIGKQLRAVGITMLHSPVCDINVNAANPEIRFRGFSDDAETCAAHVSAFCKGLLDGGIIPMAKHYPGRGDSSTDAHFELEQIRIDKETLMSRELLPYKRAIKDGVLKGVMTCHSAYPLVVGEDDLPATVSKVLVTDILRNELGFDGVITSDAMGMGAIVNRYGLPNACVKALQAGVNLMLVKSDDDSRAQVYFRMLDAVRKGEVSEEFLSASVRKVLEAKYDQGLFDNAQVDAPAAPSIVRSDEVLSTAQRSAAESLTLMRDEANLLPLKRDQKVLVIEQIKMAEFTANDTYQGHWRLNAAILEQSDNVINADCEFVATDDEADFLCALAKTEADVVLVTNFFWRHAGGANTKFVERLIAEGNKVVVLTNDPYADGAPGCAPTVLCSFSLMGESMKAAAAALYGNLSCSGTLPINNAQKYTG